MSPVADLHGDFCLHLSSFLLQTLKGKPFRVKLDIFRYFKAVFYETIGVKEYFIGEGGIGCSKIIKAYRAAEREFVKIAPRAGGYFSEVLGCQIPKKWNYEGE